MSVRSETVQLITNFPKEFELIQFILIFYDTPYVCYKNAGAEVALMLNQQWNINLACHLCIAATITYVLVYRLRYVARLGVIIHQQHASSPHQGGNSPPDSRPSTGTTAFATAHSPNEVGTNSCSGIIKWCVNWSCQRSANFYTNIQRGYCSLASPLRRVYTNHNTQPRSRTVHSRFCVVIFACIPLYWIVFGCSCKPENSAHNNSFNVKLHANIDSK